MIKNKQDDKEEKMEIDEEVTKNMDIRMLEEEVGSSGGEEGGGYPSPLGSTFGETTDVGYGCIWHRHSECPFHGREVNCGAEWST